MAVSIDTTHDPALQSWVESANDPWTNFPIQNLPFGRFRRADDMDWCIGVAIGDQVLDLRRGSSRRCSPGGWTCAAACAARGRLDAQKLNAFFSALARPRVPPAP